MQLNSCYILIVYSIILSSCTNHNGENLKIVEVYDEPKHIVVYQKNDVKILDEQLMPHDTTLFHIHKNPIFYVSFGWQKDAGQLLNGEWSEYEPEWPLGEIYCDTSYASKPIIHRSTNGGNSKSRLIGILNMGSGKDSSCNSDEYEICNKWFRSNRIVLNEGDTITSSKPDFPFVFVFVNKAKYILIENDQIAFSEKDWAYLENQYMLINKSKSKLEVIKVEVLN